MSFGGTLKSKFAAFAALPAGKKALISGGVVLGLGLIGFSIYAYNQQVNRETCGTAECIGTATYSPTASPTPTPTPSVLATLLDGTKVAPGSENIHPLAVMIENHPDARPQSGLGQASLVYEAIAEGGITRFMAVFADPRQAIKVGPVRSARTYFIDYATELKAFYAHVGGSSDGLAQIKNTGVLDLDQSYIGSPTFHREPKGGVATEHTMYSSTELLWKYATETMKWSQTADFAPWLFQDDIPAEKRAPANGVQVNFSEALYRADWAYDPATNNYVRSMAGALHKDANTGNPITAKNIVIQIVESRMKTLKPGTIGWSMSTEKSGRAIIVQNGIAIEGSWKKEGNPRTRYYDAHGKEIAFVAGPTWVELVHPDTSIKY